MKRMVLGFLVFSLISFSPVFAGKFSDDGTINAGTETEGVTGGKNLKEKITATDEMVEAAEAEVDKTGLYKEGTEKPVQE